MFYLETGNTDPCFNLAFEEFVLRNRSSGDWLILWQNANTIVIGLNQNAEEEINRPFVMEKDITVVRRMTGGGAVYHDLGNLNYSFLSDLGDAGTLCMDRFTAPVCRALRAMGVQAEASGRNDITVNGKKISGTAQRIFRDRVLHHGTLLFDSDPEKIAGALNAQPDKFVSKSAKSVRSRVGNIRDFLRTDMELPEFWSRLLDELSGGGLVRATLSEAELAEVRSCADAKYRSWDWTYGRSPDYNFKNKRRFPGGTLCVELFVQDGRIKSASFQGDFMAMCDNSQAVRALLGTPFDRASSQAALETLNLAPMFGAIGLDDILDTIYG